MLGIFDLDKTQWENFKKLNISVSDEFIIKKIKERDDAKREKNFDLADKIREELFNNGIIIDDLKDKTVWKLK